MTKRRIIGFALIVAFAATLWFVFFGGDTSGKDKGAVAVEVLPAYRTVIFDSVEALGTTLANESIDITPTVTEAISEIRFEDGQSIKKGEVIALLAQREETAQLQAAQARQVENQRELKRLQELLKSNAAPKRDYDERLTLIEVGRREVEEMEATVEDRTLRAPFDGVLGIRRLSPGALVQPGQVITTLDDISRIKLDFAVPSIYLDTLKPGVAIEAFSDALQGRKFTGEVASVNTRVDPVTRSILIRAVLPNGDGMLKPGLLLRVALLRDRHEGVVVAEESLIQRGRDYFVYVLEGEDGFSQRKVGLGTRRPGMVEITTGVEEGEKVITRGINVVREGQKVKVAKVWDRIRAPQAGNGSLSQKEPAPETAVKDDVAQ